MFMQSRSIQDNGATLSLADGETVCMLWERNGTNGAVNVRLGGFRDDAGRIRWSGSASAETTIWADGTSAATVAGGGRRMALAELLVFPAILTTAQRTDLWAYLALRWGLTPGPTMTVAIARSLPESAFWVASYPVHWDASAPDCTVTATGGVLTRWLAADDGASRAAAVVQADSNWNPTDTENASPSLVTMADGRWGIRSPHNTKMVLDGTYSLLNRLITVVFTGKWGEGIITKSGGASIWVGNGRLGSAYWSSSQNGILMWFGSGMEMYGLRPSLNQRYVLLYQANLSADGSQLTFWSMFQGRQSPKTLTVAVAPARTVNQMDPKTSPIDVSYMSDLVVHEMGLGAEGTDMAYMVAEYNRLCTKWGVTP